MTINQEIKLLEKKIQEKRDQIGLIKEYIKEIRDTYTSYSDIEDQLKNLDNEIKVLKDMEYKLSLLQLTI